MTRNPPLSNPLLLGFEELERLIDRAGKSSGEGYPPYNIERLPDSDSDAEILQITLAVAGFQIHQLDISLEGKQLTIRGRQEDDSSHDFLYRGIAARQFQRCFVLADGIEVASAELENGLLIVNLVRLEPARLIRKIDIGSAQPAQAGGGTKSRETREIVGSTSRKDHADNDSG